MAGLTAATVILGAAGLGATIGTARRQKRLEKQQTSMTKDALAQQKERQTQLDAFGRPMLQDGNQNLGIVQDYLRRLASGDRSLTMETLAPEINAMTQGQQGATSMQRSLMPRGGMGAAASAQLPYQLQGNINNLVFGARPNAMAQLGQLGGNQASLGLGAMGQGAGLTNNMLQYGLNARNQSMQEGMAMGQGIGGLGQLLFQFYNSRGSGQPGQAYTSVPPQANPVNSGTGSFNPTQPYTPSNNPYSGKM